MSLEFYVTFGQQYPRTTHPKWGPAHHDGWVRIVGALSLEHARELAGGFFGAHWSDVNPINNVEMKMMGMFYPLGEIGRIVVGPGRTVIHDARVYRMRPAVRLANAVVAHRMLGGTDEQYEAMEHAFAAWIEANAE